MTIALIIFFVLFLSFLKMSFISVKSITIGIKKKMITIKSSKMSVPPS